VKIFYGVQATGNGHITRARVMAPRLRAAGADVTYLFTGRAPDQLFEMEAFGDYQWRRGLTLITKTGRVQYLKTGYQNDLRGFARDVRELDLSGYDLVITDFEPVTSWAAWRQKIRTVGIGHQYAFGYDIPITGDDFLSRPIMRYFGPASLGLGLHWHHFNQPILPPVIETPPEPEKVFSNKILVYLPFEDIRDICNLLAGFKRHQFHVYSIQGIAHQPEHIHVKKPSRAGFHNDLRDCGGVICNAGFELPSEALQMGKKLLVKPLRSQLEQLSNALALEQARLGAVMPELDPAAVDGWLRNGKAIKVAYPDVGQAVAQWVLQGNWRIDPDWVREIWEQVVYRDQTLGGDDAEPMLAVSAA
jgi:uncharacterized protein (TIGR00661 family)